MPRSGFFVACAATALVVLGVACASNDASVGDGTINGEGGVDTVARNARAPHRRSASRTRERITLSRDAITA
jgi:hypothetical protein